MSQAHCRNRNLTLFLAPVISTDEDLASPIAANALEIPCKQSTPPLAYLNEKETVSLPFKQKFSIWVRQNIFRRMIVIPEKSYGHESKETRSHGTRFSVASEGQDCPVLSF